MTAADVARVNGGMFIEPRWFINGFEDAMVGFAGAGFGLIGRIVGSFAGPAGAFFGGIAGGYLGSTLAQHEVNDLNHYMGYRP